LRLELTFLPNEDEVELGMTNVASEKIDMHFDEDANERASELIALARMVSYAKRMATDLHLDVGAYCLDLSLQAIYEQLDPVDIEGLPDPALRQAKIERKKH
jgi:hypothetical protein